MKIASPSLVGTLFATIAGGAYVVTGHRDFAVEVHRPLPEVYGAFSDVRNFGSGLRNEGIDVPKVTVSRPSDHELVFTVPSANPGQTSRIAFAFESQPGSAITRVSAAIDVPPITMNVDGQDKYLSEDKVEERFREAIGEVGKQLDQGNSVVASKARLAMLLDTVAIFSNPDNARKLADRVERGRADMARIKQSLERNGYAVRYDGPDRIEYQRPAEPGLDHLNPAAPTTDLQRFGE